MYNTLSLPAQVQQHHGIRYHIKVQSIWPNTSNEGRERESIPRQDSLKKKLIFCVELLRGPPKHPNTPTPFQRTYLGGSHFSTGSKIHIHTLRAFCIFVCLYLARKRRLFFLFLFLAGLSDISKCRHVLEAEPLSHDGYKKIKDEDKNKIKSCGPASCWLRCKEGREDGEKR